MRLHLLLCSVLLLAVAGIAETAAAQESTPPSAELLAGSGIGRREVASIRVAAAVLTALSATGPAMKLPAHQRTLAAGHWVSGATGAFLGSLIGFAIRPEERWSPAQVSPVP